MGQDRLPTFDDVKDAAKRLTGIAHRTPVLTSHAFDALTGATVFFKAENLQRGGAFKFRGAYNAINRLDIAARSRGILAFSSGNHAQGIAYAAKLHNVPAVIVMPTDAPAAKLAATRGYGAEVVTYDRYSEDRGAIARRLSAERGMTLIPPFDHPDIIAGQGTAALELFEETGFLDRLYVCTGGGGLLAGCALVANALSPDCQVVGVEPEAGNDVQQSFQRGAPVTIETPKTLADGAMTTRPGDITFAIIKQYVSAIETIGDEALVEMMRFYAERMKIIVEPTGCLSAAAVKQAGEVVKGQRIGVVISGGNVDMARFAALLAG